MKKTIVLHFKETSWNQPIVYKLIKDYNLIFNILKANISPRQKGLLVLELIGEELDFKRGLEYLRSLDIAVESLEKGVVRVESRCIQCGACTTACPTKALDINRATMEVTFDVSKCIGCESCVKVCPPRAMEVNLAID